MLNRRFDSLCKADDDACDAIVHLLERRMGSIEQIALYLAAAVLGSASAMVLGGASVLDASLCAVILLIWCFALLGKTRLTRLDAWVSLALLSALFAVRMAVLPVVSPDCQDYLLVWADVMADLSFKEVMARQVGDYTVFYQYFVYILARLPFDRVLMYKALSFLFEALLGWGAASLTCAARTKEKDSSLFRIVFLLTLALPTVLLNSAVWAQCDAIYAALILAGFSLALKNHPVRASLCLGFSLCVKLQAIFLLPAVALLLLWRKLSLRHVLLMGGAFLVVGIPAMIGGKGIKAILSIYLYQMNEYKNLVLNAPNLYMLFPNLNLIGTQSTANMGMILAFTACAGILYLGAQYREKIAVPLLNVLFALSVCIPFFLPYMHERYFFTADVLSIVYAAIHPRRAYIPCLVVFGSLNGYAAYLFGGTLIPWNVAALAMAAAGILAIWSIGEAVNIQ